MSVNCSLSLQITPIIAPSNQLIFPSDLHIKEHKTQRKQMFFLTISSERTTQDICASVHACYITENYHIFQSRQAALSLLPKWPLNCPVSLLRYILQRLSAIFLPALMDAVLPLKDRQTGSTWRHYL